MIKVKTPATDFIKNARRGVSRRHITLDLGLIGSRTANNEKEIQNYGSHHRCSNRRIDTDEWLRVPMRRPGSSGRVTQTGPL